jgi:hypothetical protein
MFGFFWQLKQAPQHGRLGRSEAPLISIFEYTIGLQLSGGTKVCVRLLRDV